MVDDGSVDNTVQLARDAGVRVLQNPGNRGKGYSVKHGMLEAKGEWTLFTDADLSSPIGEVEKLWSAAGARAAPRSPSDRAPWTARWSACTSPSSAKRSAACSMRAMRLVTGLPFKDTQCGFKLFQTSAGARSLLPPATRRLRLRRRSAVHRQASSGFSRWKFPCDGITWRAPRSVCCWASSPSWTC